MGCLIGRRFGLSPRPVVTTRLLGARSDGYFAQFGTLKYVAASHGTAKHCHLVIEHDSEYYIGALMFDDAKFCWMVSTALQYHHIGRSIKEIGDLDFSYTL
jgi:hypothetical protein